MNQTYAMDTLVDGKTDSELLTIMVYALTSNDEALLGKLTTNSYATNDPDAAIIAAICRHVKKRVATSPTPRVDEDAQS